MDPLEGSRDFQGRLEHTLKTTGLDGSEPTLWPVKGRGPHPSLHTAQPPYKCVAAYVPDHNQRSLSKENGGQSLSGRRFTVFAPNCSKLI